MRKAQTPKAVGICAKSCLRPTQRILLVYANFKYILHDDLFCLYVQNLSFIRELSNLLNVLTFTWSWNRLLTFSLLNIDTAAGDILEQEKIPRKIL